MDLKSQISGNGFTLIPGNGYLTLKLIGLSDVVTSKEMDAVLTAQIIDPFPHVVINCEHTSTIPTDWCRILLITQKNLGKVNKKLRLVNVSQALQSYLKKNGVDSAFKSAPTLREALVEFGLVTKKSLDTDFINPFLTATLKVLEVQAKVSAKPGKIFMKEASDHFKGDVSGVIGIVSESFNGSVVISFPEATFLKVMTGMLGEEITEMSKDIVDGTGEIINMIFGQAKISLNEKGYGIKTALPSVVSGKDHSLSTKTSGPTVVIPFESNCGNFFVEISLSA